ncbi:unannotated protein [freshwater metagenome]|uniref:Unannotated protein n=1 Tax=freshwater metagenome TaxID=449393 RepID=A0A6J5YHA8_9ZZZZ
MGQDQAEGERGDDRPTAESGEQISDVGADGILRGLGGQPL